MNMECLNEGEDCAGLVAKREALSGSGLSFPRCEAHWELRLLLEDELNERYPVPSADWREW